MPVLGNAPSAHALVFVWGLGGRQSQSRLSPVFFMNLPVSITRLIGPCRLSRQVGGLEPSPSSTSLRPSVRVWVPPPPQTPRQGVGPVFFTLSESETRRVWGEAHSLRLGDSPFIHRLATSAGGWMELRGAG